jgi:hypothetical protein
MVVESYRKEFRPPVSMTYSNFLTEPVRELYIDSYLLPEALEEDIFEP